MKLRDLVNRCGTLGVPNEYLGLDCKRACAVAMKAIGLTYGPVYTTVTDYDAVMTAILNRWKAVKS